LNTEGGSLLDVANRAEKRQLIDSIEQLRELKDIRNHIVHEYIDEDLKEIFEEILKATQTLFDMIQRIFNYSQKII